MVFSQLTFLYYFLPIVMIVYFFASDKIRNVLIFITGLLFYAWGEPFYVCLMLLSTAIDYTAGRLMAKYDDDNKKRKICLIVSVCMNVGLLAIFKYSDFLIDSFNGVFGTSITNPVVLVNKALNSLYPFGLNEKRVELPIGISFYTFQSMSYTIDLYLRNIKVQKSFLNFASYVSLFPQIVAGPIVRYEDVANELESRTVNIAKISAGIGLFVKGLAKKVLLANNIGMVWTQIKAMDYSTISVATAWLGIIAFAFQIYFDFSGYSDMAIGLGLMFGFHFNENFNYPYCSASVSEFWRRWHISLGTWFRDYVYFPLGGSRVSSKSRLVFNLFVVWMLTGIWHGASWNYVAWGFFYFVLLTFEKLTGIPKKLAHTWQRVLYRIFTLLCVMFGWVVFRAPGLKMGLSYIRSMFCLNGNAFADTASLNLIGSYALVAVLGIVFCMPVAGFVRKKIPENPKAQLAAEICTRVICLVLLAISCSFAVSSSYNPFIYFNF
mgnify:CR=1 FL=1